MAVTTAADIVRLALKDAGVLGIGQSANAEDTNDVFDTLNIMIAGWNVKRWMIFHLLDLSVVSTGAISYTVGPGGDIDTPRPDRLEDGCFYRQLVPTSAGVSSYSTYDPTNSNPIDNTGILGSGSQAYTGFFPNQIDYPLEILESREDYSRIGLKPLSTIPQYIFYDAAYPMGVIYPWPIPSAVKYEIHIAVKAQLTEFANLSDLINLPRQYLGALRYNLGATIRPLYQMPPDPTLTALAMTSLNIIKNSNAQIPRLRIPLQLSRGLLYNIFSGRLL